MSEPTERGRRVTQLERGYDELRTLLNRALTERDRPQAENAALVAALRDILRVAESCNTRRKYYVTIATWARAALAAHAARTERGKA